MMLTTVRYTDFAILQTMKTFILTVALMIFVSIANAQWQKQKVETGANRVTPCRRSPKRLGQGL
jgi:hypothetical protein